MFIFGLVAVLLIRLTFPLIILKKPFIGSLLGIAADASDIYFFIFLGKGISSDAYDMIDKSLDMYTLSLMLFVIMRDNAWFAKKVGLSMFMLRLIGFIVYEITKIRAIYLFFLMFLNFMQFFILV